MRADMSDALDRIAPAEGPKGEALYRHELVKTLAHLKKKNKIKERKEKRSSALTFYFVAAPRVRMTCRLEVTAQAKVIAAGQPGG